MACPTHTHTCALHDLYPCTLCCLLPPCLQCQLDEKSVYPRINDLITAKLVDPSGSTAAGADK